MEKKKKSVLQFYSGCKMHSCSCGKSSFHILVYAAAGCIMNRRSRSKITDAPTHPRSGLNLFPPLKEGAISIHLIYTQMYTCGIRKGVQWDGRTGDVSINLPVSLVDGEECANCTRCAGSCESPIPRLSKQCFCFTYIQFSFSSGAGVCRRF